MRLVTKAGRYSSRTGPQLQLFPAVFDKRTDDESVADRHIGEMSILRRVLRWLPRATDLLNAVQWLFPPVGALAIFLLASVQDVPPYLIVFYSIIGICSITLTIAGVHYVVRHRAVFERLRYVRTEPVFVNPIPVQNTVGIMFKCYLMNMSQTQSMYVALRRADVRLQGRTNPDPVLKNEQVIVPPLSDFAFSVAAVPNVDVSREIKGKLEVEIEYGPRPNDLPYILTYEFEPTIQIDHLTEKGAQIIITGPLKRYQHKRA